MPAATRLWRNSPLPATKFSQRQNSPFILSFNIREKLILRNFRNHEKQVVMSARYPQFSLRILCLAALIFSLLGCTRGGGGNPFSKDDGEIKENIENLMGLAVGMTKGQVFELSGIANYVRGIRLGERLVLQDPQGRDRRNPCREGHRATLYARRVRQYGQGHGIRSQILRPNPNRLGHGPVLGFPSLAFPSVIVRLTNDCFSFILDLFSTFPDEDNLSKTGNRHPRLEDCGCHRPDTWQAGGSDRQRPARSAQAYLYAPRRYG